MSRKYAIKWYNELDSTNNEALRLLSTNANMSVIAARSQTAGRGQRGNSWSAEAGQNLTFSILLRFGTEHLPEMPAKSQFSISQAVTLALTELLHTKGVEGKVKWSNDIYVGDRKIAGILIENALSGNGLANSVIGIGLNTNQTEFPSNLPNPTSMLIESGSKFKNEALLEEYMDIFDSYMQLCFSVPGRKRLKDGFRSNMYRFGEMHEFNDLRTDTTFTGRITGVSDIGMLEISDADGIVREYGFKEISFVIK